MTPKECNSLESTCPESCIDEQKVAQLVKPSFLVPERDYMQLAVVHNGQVQKAPKGQYIPRDVLCPPTLTSRKLPNGFIEICIDGSCTTFDPGSAVTPPPSVYCQVSGMPIPLNYPLVWNGTTYATEALFTAAVKQFVGQPSAGFTTASATFTFSTGTTCPALVVSAPVANPVTCQLAFQANSTLSFPLSYPVMFGNTLVNSQVELLDLVGLEVNATVSGYNANTGEVSLPSGTVCPDSLLSAVVAPNVTCQLVVAQGSSLTFPLSYPLTYQTSQIASQAALLSALGTAANATVVSFNANTGLVTFPPGTDCPNTTVADPAPTTKVCQLGYAEDSAGNPTVPLPLAYPVRFAGGIANTAAQLTALVNSAFGGSLISFNHSNLQATVPVNVTCPVGLASLILKCAAPASATALQAFSFTGNLNAPQATLPTSLSMSVVGTDYVKGPSIPQSGASSLFSAVNTWQVEAGYQYILAFDFGPASSTSSDLTYPLANQSITLTGVTATSSLIDKDYYNAVALLGNPAVYPSENQNQMQSGLYLINVTQTGALNISINQISVNAGYVPEQGQLVARLRRLDNQVKMSVVSVTEDWSLISPTDIYGEAAGSPEPTSITAGSANNFLYAVSFGRHAETGAVLTGVTGVSEANPIPSGSCNAYLVDGYTSAPGSATITSSLAHNVTSVPATDVGNAQLLKVIELAPIANAPTPVWQTAFSQTVVSNNACDVCYPSQKRDFSLSIPAFTPSGNLGTNSSVTVRVSVDNVIVASKTYTGNYGSGPIPAVSVVTDLQVPCGTPANAVVLIEYLVGANNTAADTMVLPTTNIVLTGA